MLRILTTATLSTALLALAAPALAQDGGNWSFQVGAGTDNRSKDASKSGGDPFVWGQAQWESDDGLFYAGPSFETIKAGGSEMELAAQAGVRPQWAGFDFDLSAKHQWRHDTDPGQDADAWEFTADMKRSIGPAGARLRVQHSPDGTGSTKAWTWVALRGGWDFNDKLTATAEIGRREQDNNIDYTGYNIGVSYALTRSVEADLRWHGTDVETPGEQYADALVAGISLAF